MRACPILPIVRTTRPPMATSATPLLVKASAGGGGKGMRVVESADATRRVGVRLAARGTERLW